MEWKGRTIPADDIVDDEALLSLDLKVRDGLPNMSDWLMNECVKMEVAGNLVNKYRQVPWSTSSLTTRRTDGSKQKKKKKEKTEKKKKKYKENLASLTDVRVP